MEIQQKDNGERGKFFVEMEDQIVGEIIYSWQGHDRIIIEHTEVDESLKGKGIGKQLVEKSVEFAREKGIKVVPICTFAKAVFHKTPEFSDVL